MAVIDESVVIAAVRAFPSEDDIIGIAFVTVIGGLVQLGRVCNAESAVRITGIYHRSVGVYSLACVDLGKAGVCHGDAHNIAIVISRVADVELAVSLSPRRYLVCAICILEELKCDTVLEVRYAFLGGIYKTVVCEIRSCRGYGRERRDYLVLKYIADRCGCGMCKSVCDVCAAIVLAAAGLCFTHSLFKRRDAGKVLGVKRHIIEPACVICGAGHGQRDEEGRGSLSDHFGDAGLNKEVQAERQV